MIIYVKTTLEEMDSLPFVYSVSRQPHQDQFMIVWCRDAAKNMGLNIVGNAHVINTYQMNSWPEHVEAENWWHLCSIVGITEPVAKVLYKKLGDGETL